MPLLKPRKRSKPKPKAKPKQSQKQTQSQTVIVQGGEPVKRRKQSARKPGVGNKTHEAKAPSTTDALLLTLLDTFKKADLSREQNKFELIKTEAPRAITSAQQQVNVHTARQLSPAEQDEADRRANAPINPITQENARRLQAEHMSAPYSSAGSNRSGSGLGNAMAESMRHRNESAQGLGEVSKGMNIFS